MSDDAFLDMDDPHEAHAVFAMRFACESCEKELVPDSKGEPFTNRWYSDLARLAKDRKWFTPSADAEGKMDVMRTWCPECAVRLGLSADSASLPPSHYERL